MTVSSIVEAIHIACQKGTKITVANYNIHSFNLSLLLPWFYDFLHESEITHCDSVGILNAIRWMGLDLPLEYRASYTLLMPKLLEMCDHHQLSVFLLGTTSDNIQSALKNLHQQYPNLTVAGHHGYFDLDDPQQNEAIIQQINQLQPQILIVGMGMPQQEGWIRQHRDRLQVNAILLGGAVIDRLAGVVPSCPLLIANSGLEWLFRLFREPKRLAPRYLIGNPAFFLVLALGKFYAPALSFERMSSPPSVDDADLLQESEKLNQEDKPLPNHRSLTPAWMDKSTEVRSTGAKF